MFRDYLEQQPEYQAIPQQKRRLAINLFYTGLLCAAKWCLGATGQDDLKSRVRTAFEEVEDFAYGAFRKQAKELVKKFGLVNARQRLRAIALDKDMTPEQASVCFGVDLLDFDGVEELVNLTRALRNRGVDFKIEIDKPGTPQSPNTYSVEDNFGVPASALGTMFGGAKIVDNRPKNAEPSRYSDAPDPIADAAQEEVESILADENRDDEDDMCDYIENYLAAEQNCVAGTPVQRELQNNIRAIYEQIAGRLDRKTPQAYTDRPHQKIDYEEKI